MPGLVNAHTHISMNVFRGLADDMRLIDWLTQAIWPTEAKLVCPELCRLGSRHAMAEMIRSGTTCFNDMYFFPDATAEVRYLQRTSSSPHPPLHNSCCHD
jgi:5-methylthioadenosine/S-adenosylhomocysteine deaminase